MKIGFAKGDLTKAIILKSPNPEEKPLDEVIFTERVRKLFDLSDKFILRMMNERRGIPDRIAEPIEMAAMYGEDENGPWVILSFDLCESGYRLVDTIKAPVTGRFGISSDRIIVLYSHVHIGVTLNEEYLKSIVLSTVENAARSSEEVEIAQMNMEIDSSLYTVNRRVDIEGVGTRTVMFNNYCEVKENYIDATRQIEKWIEDLGFNYSDYIRPDTEVRSSGPVDNNLDGLFFRSRTTGMVIGSFVHFSCHPVIVSQLMVKGEISADFPGHMKKRIEQRIGGVAVFGNGPCGDIKPLNTEYSHDFARNFGSKLADVLLEGLPAAGWIPLEKVGFLSEPVVLSIDEDFPRNALEAEKKIEELERSYDSASTPAARRALQNRYRIYSFAKEELLTGLRPEWLDKRQVEFNMHAIRLNDTAIMTTNGEIFTSTGKAMIELYKDKHPLLATVADEELYYVVPEGEFEKGGYEVGGCFLAAGSAEKLITHSHRLLGQAFG